MKKNKNDRKKIKILWLSIIFAFSLMEFPGIFLINRIEPMIAGFPFLYGFTLIIWLILCVLLYIGYRLRWGEEVQEEEICLIEKK